MLINLNQAIQDVWTVVEDDQDLLLGESNLISLQRLEKDWKLFKAEDLNLAVELKIEDEAQMLEGYLSQLKMIVLSFDLFSDGRAFSQAHLIRHRFGFDGIIRAKGAVLQDQLLFMQRCGFTQFDIAPEEDTILALQQFSNSKHWYQPVQQIN